MKIKNILLIITVLILTLSWVKAEYRIYDNVKDFEAAKGSICEAATDGCNNFFMKDWKVAGGTRKFCKDHTPEWTCTKFKENSITTLSLTETTSVDSENLIWWDRDEHGCIPSAWYTWSAKKEKCIRVWEESTLSENDKNFYNTIKNRLEDKYQKKVNNTLRKYKNKLKKYSNLKKEKLNERIIMSLEQNISLLLMKYPQDVALPKKVNNAYLTLELFKFELMQLEF